MTGDLLYASASNTLSRLAAGSTGLVLAMAAGVPSWAAPGTSLGVVRNFQGSTNGATPSTKWDMTADFVVLRNPTTGATRTIAAGTTTLTNDIAAATTVNGRDSAGVFATSAWIYFYFVGTGSGAATCLSSGSPTGPALLTGQTEWALAGAVFNNAAPTLVPTVARGSWIYYQLNQTVVATSIATVQQTTNVAAFIPPMAMNYLVRAQTINDAAGANVARLRIVNGLDYYVQTVTVSDRDSASVQMPNVNQTLFWITDGTVGSFTLECLGYQIPNGG